MQGAGAAAHPNMHVPNRHGCLTAWLYLIIVGGTFGLCTLLLASKMEYRPGYHPPTPLVLGTIVGCLLVSMACAGGLLLLKRWAFYGYILANLVLCGVNLAAGIDAARALVPLFWVACLIGVMQIGSPREKAWRRLR